MDISRLRNKFLGERTYEFKIAYNKQRNICVSLLRKTKRENKEQKYIIPTAPTLI